MHGQEEVAARHGRSDERADARLATTRLDDHPLAGPQAQARRVVGMDLDVRISRAKLSEDVGLGRTRLRVPLRGTAPAGQELKRKLAARRLGCRPRFLEDEPGAAVGVVETAVGEQPPLRGEVSARCREGPLNATRLVKNVVVGNAGDVARHPGRQLLENLEDGLGRLPRGEHRATAVIVSD